MTIGDAAVKLVEVIKETEDDDELANALIDFGHAILEEASRATDAKLVGVVFE